MARQQVGNKKLRRWSRLYGLRFVTGLHRGGWRYAVALVDDDHRHWRLDPHAANASDPEVRWGALMREDEPIHFTSCPD